MKKMDIMSSITVTQRTDLPSYSVRPKSEGHSDIYFDTFPNEIEENEKFILQKVDEAWQARNVERMFQLIKENTFSEMVQKQVIDYWDKGHYFQALEKSGKPLTALARFRIRQRNIPPESIAPHGRQKSTLPKEATAILRDWLERNSHRPYPSKEEKTKLAQLTKLSIMQVNTWYANSRRRIRGRRAKSQLTKQGNAKSKRAWNRTSPQPWNPQVPMFPPTRPTTPTSAFTSFCDANIAPTSLGSSTWQDMSNTNRRTFMEWPSSHAAAHGNQYLTTPVVTLAPIFWKPELQYCGLHAAAQILMDMASK